MKPLLALSFLALAASVQAQVVTIDQAKALAGGVTPGDEPGFPITISQPGSYRLMSDLTVSDVSVNGIAVTASGVTIDLNGFSLTGPRCGPTRCHVGPGGNGIAGSWDTTVLNGYISNFAGSGMHFASRATVVNVRSRRNGRCGAIVNSQSLVRDSAFSNNAECGLWIGSGVVRSKLIVLNEKFQAAAVGGALFSGNNLLGVNPNLPGDQSLGDNLCTVPGTGTQRC